jgi:hypothetical protein
MASKESLDSTELLVGLPKTPSKNVVHNLTMSKLRKATQRKSKVTIDHVEDRGLAVMCHFINHREKPQCRCQKQKEKPALPKIKVDVRKLCIITDQVFGAKLHYGDYYLPHIVSSHASHVTFMERVKESIQRGVRKDTKTDAIGVFFKRPPAKGNNKKKIGVKTGPEALIKKTSTALVGPPSLGALSQQVVPNDKKDSEDKPVQEDNTFEVGDLFKQLGIAQTNKGGIRRDITLFPPRFIEIDTRLRQRSINPLQRTENRQLPPGFSLSEADCDELVTIMSKEPPLRSDLEKRQVATMIKNLSIFQSFYPSILRRLGDVIQCKYFNQGDVVASHEDKV